MLALAVVLVGCIVVLVLLHEDPRWFTALRAEQGHPAAGASGSSGASGTSGASGRRRRPAATTTSRPTTTTSANAPRITSISPATGTAGQRVTVSGKNFFSADHVITGYFGSAQAPTSCPTLEQCVLTLPAGVKGQVAVTIHTQSGVSNSEPFTAG